MSTSDTWDPDQYGRFAAERDQPFHDLISLVEPSDSPTVLDLGCGDGRLTALAHRRLRARATLGVDSSSAMLAQAATHAGDGLAFASGDLAAPPAEPVDVIVANAALHWVGDHPGVLRTWTGVLRPGGQLAVQVPANADHPSHTVIADVVDELGLDPAPAPDPVATNVLPPEGYASLLDEFGYDRQHVRLQVYVHRMASSADVVEWVKGTTLTRVREVTDADGYAAFLDRFRERLLAVIGERSPYTFLFKRILFWGRLGG